MYLNFQGYSTYFKVSNVNPNQGGGVAVLIRSDIAHSLITGIDEHLEIVGLKIELEEVCFDFFSLYSPPCKVIPYEFFSSLEITKTNFILVGDLNAKSKSIGCKSQNSSGDVLDEILTDFSIIIHNDESPTYFQYQGEIRENELNINQYTELLDLVLSSSDLANKVHNFEVLTEHSMDSDHCPIIFEVRIRKTTAITREMGNRLNFSKANWELYG